VKAQDWTDAPQSVVNTRQYIILTSVTSPIRHFVDYLCELSVEVETFS